MSEQDKKRDNYLCVAYILLKIAPYAIEKYVDKHYSGGFIGALRDKAHILKEKATPDQRKILLPLCSKYEKMVLLEGSSWS